MGAGGAAGGRVSPRDSGVVWGRSQNQGYLRVASRVARVRFRPAPRTFGSSRVSRRSDWALPSNPPASAASSLRAVSPLWPNGLWPMSCARQAASTRSGSQPISRPSSRPICAHSREWVSLVRGKSAEPAVTTWVLAASRRSAALCRTRARSRSKSLRPARLGGSATQRAVALSSYLVITCCRSRRRPARRGLPPGGRSGRGTASRTRSPGRPRGRSAPSPGRRRARRRRRGAGPAGRPGLP